MSKMPQLLCRVHEYIDVLRMTFELESAVTATDPENVKRMSFNLIDLLGASFSNLKKISL